MKIYTEKNKEAKSSVEILLDYQELNVLVSSLVNFEKEIEQFKAKNKEAVNIGFTHLHLKDCGLIEATSKSDVVFYIDLDDKQ